jgi:hypothetical protein
MMLSWKPQIKAVSPQPRYGDGLGSEWWNRHISSCSIFPSHMPTSESKMRSRPERVKSLNVEMIVWCDGAVATE